MRVLASSVLGMEIFVIGFAILLAKDTGSTGIWIGAIIALLLIYTTSQMKKKRGWVLGSILQFALIGYGYFVGAMYLMGGLFAALWISAVVVGRKGEAIRAQLMRDQGKEKQEIPEKISQLRGIGTLNQNARVSIERTLILIKPDGVRRGLTGEVIRRIEAKNYRITALKMITPSRELFATHYAEHEGKPFYEPLLEFMLSGQIVAMIAEGNRVIEGFRKLAGTTDPTTAEPGTIRGDLARDEGTKVVQNIVHGSDSVESANREIKIFFPELS